MGKRPLKNQRDRIAKLRASIKEAHDGGESKVGAARRIGVDDDVVGYHSRVMGLSDWKIAKHGRRR